MPLIKMRTCPTCGKKTEELKLTPPYDARPATDYDIKEIQKLILENFGIKDFISPEDIVLINNVGSEDRMDEIIYFDVSLGTKRYDLKHDKWIIRLNEYGLKMLENKIAKKWVKVDKIGGEKIQTGANILIPGIVETDEKIKKGDYIAILNQNEEVIAGGIARISDSARKEKDKGVYAKNYQTVSLKSLPKFKKNSWDAIIKANIELLKEAEQKAIEYIKKKVTAMKLPFMVSYSGGKDSLVTLYLVKQAFPEAEFPIIFINTGIEFPETVEHVKKSIEKLKLEKQLIIEEVSSDIFWRAFDKFGPPGRDYRYCCKFAKLAPIKKTISKFYGNENKCLSFVGQRRYESYIRASDDMWTNPYIPDQINISPIQDWTAFMIWLYIYWKKLPYLKLYDRGYERIGCWLCPSSDIAHLELLKKNHPQNYENLKEKIINWQMNHGLTELYWNKGLWRFKEIPKKIRNVVPLSEKERLKIKKNHYELKSLNIVEGKKENKIIIGSLSKKLDLQKIKNISPILESYKEIEWIEGKKINFKTKKYNATFNKQGSFHIEMDCNLSKSIITDCIVTQLFTVIRSLECVACGLCAENCYMEAIRINKEKNGVIIVEEKCTHCHQCFDWCPIITIVYNNLGRKIYHSLWS